MARTFKEWMTDNGLSTGYGPGYVYSKQGGSGDRAGAIRSWQAEEGANTIAEMMKNLGGASTNAPSTDNRFASGLSDAESRLRALLDNPDSIQQTGAYKFRVKQGEDALQRQMGAKGMLNSGNRLMDLMKYGQEMGSQEYDAQAGRLANLLGTYGQGFIADKNANTNLFSATEQDRSNDNRNALGWANLFQSNSGSSGGGRAGVSVSPFSQNFGSIGGSWNPETDHGIARLRQARIDAANY